MAEKAQLEELEANGHPLMPELFHSICLYNFSISVTTQKGKKNTCSFKSWPPRDWQHFPSLTGRPREDTHISLLNKKCWNPTSAIVTIIVFIGILIHMVLHTHAPQTGFLCVTLFVVLEFMPQTRLPLNSHHLPLLCWD